MQRLNEYKAEILENAPIARDTYELILRAEYKIDFKPGQFLDLTIDGFFLRRPISICDVEGTYITLIYKVVGEGTEHLAQMRKGQSCKFLAPLGNGFNLDNLPQKVQLVGGGVGVPPLYLLAKDLVEKGHDVEVILGFRSELDSFYISEFYDLGCDVKICTEDGSLGAEGFVTKLVNKNIYTMACGPLPMLKALSEVIPDGEYSLEARMGCGFGACMGCSIMTKDGSKQVCKDGPVFKGSELIW